MEVERPSTVTGDRLWKGGQQTPDEGSGRRLALRRAGTPFQPVGGRGITRGGEQSPEMATASGCR